MEIKDSTEGKIPRLPHLLAWTDEGVMLRSAICRDCDTYFFPEYFEQHRPGCPRKHVEKVLLSRKGRLASYTIQHYICPPPFLTDGDITPYGIGLVEFQEGISIVGLIMESDLQHLEIGSDMETITYTLFKDENENDIVTWAFRVVQ